MTENTPSGNDNRSVAVRTTAALLLLVFALFGAAFLYAYRQSAPPTSQGLTVVPASADAASDSAEAPAAAAATSEIVVHVVGAVQRPGVVRLTPGKRVIDAIEAAGGALSNADLQSINLASHAVDGDQIVVPVHGDAAAAPAQRSEPASQSAPAKITEKLGSPSDGTVNINTADAEELQRLPGIGPAMSARIIAYRKEIGRFTAVEQLLDVSGIGEKRLSQLKPFVRIR